MTWLAETVVGLLYRYPAVGYKRDAFLCGCRVPLPVSFPEVTSSFSCTVYDRQGEANMEDGWTMLAMWKVTQYRAAGWQWATSDE